MLGKEEEEEEEEVVVYMDKAWEVVVDLDMDKAEVSFQSSCCGEVTSATTILPAVTENQSQDIMVLRISVLINCFVPIRNRI